MERILDIAADELGIDPVAIRRKNFIQPDAFPYMPNTGLGATYDTGEYDKALDAVLEHAGYDELARRAEGSAVTAATAVLMGIGVSSYLEISAPMVLTQEFGSVEIEDDGTVTTRVGTSAHGQGHETAFSQIVADTLGVPFENVRVLHSDTDEVPRGGGTGGSRSGQIGGSALLVASREVLAQAKRLAAHLLEANPDDIVVGDDGLEVAGVPASKLGVGRSGRGREGSGEAARRRARSGCSTSSTSRPAGRRSRSVRTSRSSRSTRRPDASSWCATSRSTTAARSSTR